MAGGTGAAGGACGATSDCGSICNPGKNDCSTGLPVCIQAAAPPGTTCGAGKVCDGKGACVACAAGGMCGNVCKPGTYDCSSGAQTCSQKIAPTGTDCGAGQVCDGNGSCVTCMMGNMCGSACNPGMFACGTGAPVCTGQQMKAAGSSCGQNKVCDAGGTCVDCTPNATCGDVCKPGTYSCTTGTPVCNTTNALQGKDCSGGNICNGLGSCVAKTGNGGSCQSGIECQSGNCSTGGGKSLCCQTGFQSCGSCVNVQNDGSNCGTCGHGCPAEQTCQTGKCACTGYTLSCGTCGTWNFDSGTNNLEGWMSAAVSVTNVLISTSMKHDGASSLAVLINAPADDSTFAGGGVQIPLCAGADLAGLTVTAWVYLATTNPPPTQSRYVTFNSAVPDATPGNWAQNSWVKFTTSLAQGSTLTISYGAVGGFVGTMYIDSVTIIGP